MSLSIVNSIIWSLSKYIIANNSVIFDILINLNNVKILSEVAQLIHLNNRISYQGKFIFILSYKIEVDNYNDLY